MKSTKKYLLLFFTSIAPLYSFTQDFGKWQVGVNTSPNYNQVLYTGKTSFLQKLKEGKLEKSNLGYTFGFNLNRNLNEKLSFEFGLNYEKKGIKVLSSPDDIDIAEMKESYHSLDLPIQINYWLNRSKASFFVGAGLSLSYMFTYDGHLKGGMDKYEGVYLHYFVSTSNNLNIPPRQRYSLSIIANDKPTKLERFNIIPFVLIGMNYKLNNIVSLRIAPLVRFPLLSTAKDKFTHSNEDINANIRITTEIDFVKQHIIDLGLNVGCYISIK